MAAGCEDLNERVGLCRDPAKRSVGASWRPRDRCNNHLKCVAVAARTSKQFEAAYSRHMERRERQLPSRGPPVSGNSSQDANSRTSKPSHSSRSRSISSLLIIATIRIMTCPDRNSSLGFAQPALICISAADKI